MKEEDEWGTKEERGALVEQLRKLVNDSWSCPNVIRIKKDWERFIKREKNTTNKLYAILNAFQRVGISEYEKAVMRLVFYLFVAEGGFANNMNFVCLLLTSQGHDLYNFHKPDHKKRYAHSLEEIAKVNTYTKELFLEEHDFKLFNKGLNRKLRNDIAHNYFEVSLNGTTLINGKQTDIKKEVRQILNFLVLVSNILLEESLRFLNS